MTDQPIVKANDVRVLIPTPTRPGKQIKLPDTIRVEDEMAVDLSLIKWMLTFVFIQIMREGNLSPSLRPLYAERLKKMLTWIMTQGSRSRKDPAFLSKWEVFLIASGTLVSARASVRNALFLAVYSRTVAHPTSYNYSHKLTGSVVAAQILGRTAISEFGMGAMDAYMLAVRDIIHVIDTVSFEPSTFVNEFSTYSNKMYSNKGFCQAVLDAVDYYDVPSLNGQAAIRLAYNQVAPVLLKLMPSELPVKANL
jgi:hypothetical protein